MGKGGVKKNGLSVQWTEDNDEANKWALKFLKDTLAMATRCISVIDPILSIGTALTFQMLVDPDEFIDELPEQLPTFRLLEGMMYELKRLAAETRKTWPSSWKSHTRFKQTQRRPTAATWCRKDPTQAQEADSEKSGDDSNESYSTVPSFKAISKAEFDATDFQRIRVQVVQALIKPRLWPRTR